MFKMPANRRIKNPQYKDNVMKRYQDIFKGATMGVEPSLKPQSGAKLRKFRMPNFGFKFGGKRKGR